MEMKKVILIFLVAAVSVHSQPNIPPLKNYANDFSGALSNGELNAVEQDLRDFDAQTSNQIVLLLINSLENYPIEMLAHEVAEKNGIGRKGRDNGVLLLIAIKDKKLRIEVGYGLEGALPDALASSIIRNEIVPHFRSGNFYRGIQAGINAIKSATVGEYSGDPKPIEEDDDRLGLPVIYFIIFILLSLLFRGKGRGLGSLLLLGSLSGGRSSGGSFGGGGFSGGGGSFGGGGASGGW